MVPLDSFCDFCANLFRHYKGSQPEYEDHTVTRNFNQSELSESASRCALCRLTYELARRYRGDSVYPDEVEYTIKFDTEGLWDFLVLFANNKRAPQTFILEFSPYSDSDNIPSTSASASDHDHMDGPWSWLAQCMSECRDHHRACNVRDENKRPPTRLIDVGTGASASPRLVMSDMLPMYPQIEYIALSHKWGAERFTVLSSENIEAFQIDIPLDALPKTFCDAIYCARQFSIRYLWIDSLCILQDCSKDWQAEAPTMHSVYSNSYLNIAASEAENPTEGLHPQKHAHLEQPFHFWFEVGESQQIMKCHYDNWDDLAGLVPLSQRGWVLQERLASPRTIHFMSTIVWECRESRASQVSPALCRLVPEKLWRGRNLHSNRSGAFGIWDETVQVYSQCHLTKPEDKLVAISGLARIMQTFTQCDYLAGMWRADLAESMLWAPHQSAHGSCSGRTYRVDQRAPSWSWASVDGPVHMLYKSQFRDSVIDILEAETQSLHGDMFGQIKSGHIALTGTLFAMETFAEVFDQIWDGEFENDFTFGIDDYENVADDEDVYLLPLASGQLDLPSLHGRAEKPRFFSLLVQQDETADGRLAYRRLGFVIVDNEGNATGSTFYCPDWTPPSLGSSLSSEIILV